MKLKLYLMTEIESGADTNLTIAQTGDIFVIKKLIRFMCSILSSQEVF
jgi:hypothetical protein